MVCPGANRSVRRTIRSRRSTGGIDDTTHKAAVALHVVDTIVRNKYKNDAAKLAEWTIASHVEKHTPVARAKPAPTPPAP